MIKWLWNKLQKYVLYYNFSYPISFYINPYLDQKNSIDIDMYNRIYYEKTINRHRISYIDMELYETIYNYNKSIWDNPIFLQDVNLLSEKTKEYVRFLTYCYTNDKLNSFIEDLPLDLGDSREMALELVSINNLLLKNFPHYQNDKNFLIEAFSSHHPVCYLNPEIMGNPDIKFVSDELKNDRIFIFELYKIKKYINCIPLNVINDDDFQEYIINNIKNKNISSPNCNRWIPKELINDYEFFMKLIKCCDETNWGRRIIEHYYLSKFIEDPDYLIEYIRHYGFPVNYKIWEQNNWFADKYFMTALADIDIIYMRCVSYKLKDDKEFIKLIVTKNHKALKYFNQYKNDIDLVQIAVDQDPMNIQYAKSEIKCNKDFNLPLVKKNGLVLQHLNDNLKNDIDIVTEALENNKESIEFVGKNLKEHFKLYKIMKLIEQNPRFVKCMESSL
jgi:hypothetical protein